MLTKLSSIYKAKNKSDGIHGNPLDRANNVSQIIINYNSKVPKITRYRTRRFKNIVY